MQRPHPDCFSVALPRADYRVYAAAARLLTRRIGPRAPDAHRLILHEVSGRRARAIAEEYLYHIDWHDSPPSGLKGGPRGVLQIPNRVRKG